MGIDDIESELFAAWERISARAKAVGFIALAQKEQAFLSVWVLEAELNNGGFSQWMFNSDGDHAELAVATLRAIGASGAAAACERFFADLLGGRPAADRDARQRQLEAAEERFGEDAFMDACAALQEEFYAAEDNLRERLWVFVREPN